MEFYRRTNSRIFGRSFIVSDNPRRKRYCPLETKSILGDNSSTKKKKSICEKGPSRANEGSEIPIYGREGHRHNEDV